MAAPVVNIDFFVGGGLLSAAILNEIAGGSSGNVVETGITTAGDGVLTAAALVGGQIARTGPTVAFTDTTATAAAIVAALGANFVSGQTFDIRIKNNTGFAETLAAGTGVTLPGTIIVPPFSVGNYYGTVGGTVASPTVTLTHESTVPLRVAPAISSPVATALGGTGAATITAAGINGGITTRTAQTAARTDTTDTAVAIIAGNPALGTINAAVEYRYVNNGNFPITIAGGVGVTPSIVTVIPANSWARFLITRDGTATVTMVGIEQGYFPKVGTFTANGATPVTVADSRVTAGSQIAATLKTVGGTPGVSAPAVATITPQTGFNIAALALDTSVYNYEIRG